LTKEAPQHFACEAEVFLRDKSWGAGYDRPSKLCWRKIELFCGGLAPPEIASLLSAVSSILNAAGI
jgi:hypothetical protein